jgi:hypothetical protein
MKVERVTDADEALAEAVARLVPQLSPRPRPAKVEPDSVSAEPDS